MGDHYNGAYVHDDDAARTKRPSKDSDAGADRRKSDVNRVSFDDALDMIGFGRLQIIVLLVCGLFIMTVLTETMGMGLIMTAAHCDMDLTPARKGFLSSVSFMGILVSSQLWGFLADTRGRRRVLYYTMFLSNAVTLLSCFSTGYHMFVATSFLNGFFLSASSCVTYAYLQEFNAARHRPTVIAMACIFAGLAYVYIPAMGILILPQSWSLHIGDVLQFRPWRIMILLNMIPGFFAAVALIFLPESGKFFMAQGRDSEALAVLRRIYTINTGRSIDTFPVHQLLPDVVNEKPTEHDSDKAVGLLSSLRRQTVPLFLRPLRFHFLICCFLTFSVFFVSAGMGLWYPDIQNRVARSDTSSGQTVCSTLEWYLHQVSANATTAALEECNDTVSPSTLADLGILGAYYVIGYLVYSAGIRKIGQGLFLVTFLLVSGFAGLALQFVAQPMAVVVLFSTHIVFAGVCISLLTGIVISLIPTQYRAMAVSISMVSGRFGSIAGSNLVGVLLETNCSATFYLYSILMLVSGVASLWLPFR